MLALANTLVASEMVEDISGTLRPKVSQDSLREEGVYFMRMKVIGQVKDDGQWLFAKPGAKA